MKKTHDIILYLAVAAIAWLATACTAGPNPLPEPEPDPNASRTLLVYMVANNSLGSWAYDNSDIQEMVKGAKNGALGKGRLILYHSPTSGWPMLKEVKSDGSIDTLKIYENVTNSVTIAQMREVIADTKQAAPAWDYAMVLWSHSLGWLQDGIQDADDLTTVSRSGMCYSYGSDNGKKMNLTALAKALSGQDLSFIYCDCCLMGNIETIYQLRGVAPYIVASPTEVPLSGMPYDLNLKYFFADTPDLVGAAKSTYDYHMIGYDSKNSCPVSMAVYDMSKIDALADATLKIYQAADGPYPAAYQPQKLYNVASAMCFFDMEHYVRALCSDESVFAAWKAALQQAVIYHEHSNSIWGLPVETSCGFSTFIMKDTTDSTYKGYNQLQWYQDVAVSLF